MDVNENLVCDPEDNISAGVIPNVDSSNGANNAPYLGSSQSSATTVDSERESSNPSCHSSKSTSECSGCRSNHGARNKTSVKKKRKGYVVGSRYKQAAIQFSSQRFTTPKVERTKVTKVGTGKHSEVTTTTKSVPTTARKRGGRFLESGKISNIVSTPAFNISNLPAPVYDVSSIIAEQTFAPTFCRNEMLFPGPQLPKTMCKPFRQRQIDRTHLPCEIPEFVLGETKDKTKQGGEPLSDIEMQNIYCQYLQAVALESVAKKSLEERSKDAMRQIYKLWQLNDSLIDELASVDAELQSVRHMQHLQQFLKSQEEDLTPVATVLEEIDEQYKNLAEGLDKVRHQLPLLNIIVPPCGQEDQVLGTVLDETNSILQSTMSSLEKFCVDTASACDGLMHLEQTVEAEADTLERCKDAVDMLKRMTIYESSLRIHRLQSSSERSPFSPVTGES